MTLRDYLTAAREPRYSVTFALPLLLLYEGLSALMSGSSFEGVRNGADVLLKTVFVSLGGPMGVTVFGVLLVGVGAAFVVKDLKAKGPLQSRIFLWMLGESLLYAALLGSVVSTLTALLLHPGLSVAQGGEIAQLDLSTQLVVSLGAGLYEELLFRVLLVGALAWLGLKLGWGKKTSIAVAIAGSALIFSGFHYVGPLGDQLTLASFTFRAVAGLLLSGLYVARGFGIAAWAHALYDVGLAVVVSG
ncbi:MAG: CPBP family intramembrane glutamic endopeptidase [Gemmatimonadales bacterium]